MKFKFYSKGIFKVIVIEDSIDIIADLTELKDTIIQYLEKGHKNIAVQFLNATYMYSGAISVLISCYRMIKDQNGHLCILEPQKRLQYLLERMNIGSLITICKSEDELMTQFQIS